MEENGFEVKVNDSENTQSIKSQYNIPVALYSCHTAIVNGYIIEGHVPVEEIFRLLEHQPDITGIAVGGMPPGSPGMDVPGFENDPYDVVTFDNIGNISVYARYPK